MHWDVPTLMAADALVTAVAGFLLLFAWFGDRTSISLLWWSAADLLWAIGIALLLAFDAQTGAPLTIVAPALIWSATRSFNQRRPLIVLVLAGPLVQGVSALFAPELGLAPLPGVVSLAASAIYLLAAAGELLSDLRDRLTTRWLLIAFLVLHGAVFALGTFEGMTLVAPITPVIPLSDWFGIIHFEQVVFAMGSAIFLVAMVRERREMQHRNAAHVDALTGTLTRRAFLEEAELLLDQCKERDAPWSVALFDVDRFKQVNDAYGHAVGDQALLAFARIARSRMRASDVIGRLGGEEFCVAMAGSSVGAAHALADRIRAAVAEAEIRTTDGTLHLTISGGVATAHPRSTLKELIEAADTALYRAKTLGRNRVETAADATSNRGDPVVVRVA